MTARFQATNKSRSSHHLNPADKPEFKNFPTSPLTSRSLQSSNSPPLYILSEHTHYSTVATMSSKNTSSSSSSSQGAASSGSSSESSAGSGGYEYKGSGTNSEGNHWCSRDYGSSASNDNSYHYSNTDGSYYYSNPNGSTYYNDGQGNSKYTR